MPAGVDIATHTDPDTDRGADTDTHPDTGTGANTNKGTSTDTSKGTDTDTNTDTGTGTNRDLEYRGGNILVSSPNLHFQYIVMCLVALSGTNLHKLSCL